MTTDTITTEQVSHWMRKQLAKAHEFSDYAHITVEINQEKKHADWANVTCSIYLGEDWPDTAKAGTIEGCFDLVKNMAVRNSPQFRAEKIRAYAAKLLAEAEKLETQAATL